MLLRQYWRVGACSNIGAPVAVSVPLHQCGSFGATVAVLVSAAVLLSLWQFAATVAVVLLWQFAAAVAVMVPGGEGNKG